MHKTAYERRMSYWSSDVCSSDLPVRPWLDDREVPCCASLERPTASTRHHRAVFWAHFYQGRKNAPEATARRWRALSSLRARWQHRRSMPLMSAGDLKNLPHHILRAAVAHALVGLDEGAVHIGGIVDHRGDDRILARVEIGRASCRERGCQYV